MYTARTLNLVLTIVLLASSFLPTATPLVSASPQAFVGSQRTPTRTVDAAETVNITDTGFDPATVTIRPGETVEWVNQTAQVQRIVGGTPYRIYLPLVLRDAGGSSLHNHGNDDTTAAPGASQGLVQSSGWESDDIQPGGWFTHTFATPGEYPYFLAGSLEFTGTVKVQGEPQPDFEIGVVPAARMVTQGEGVTYTVSLTATHGFTVPVALSISGLPAGTTPIWNTNPVTPTGSTVLTVTTAAGTPIGDHIFTVTGTGGGQSHDVQATLTVEASTTPDFLLDAWPATQTITRGHSITYTVAVTAVNGFTQAVTLDVGGAPAGAAVAWATNPLTPTPTADTTFAITPSASGPTGTFTLVITGTSNPVHTTQVELVVVAEPIPPTPDFELDAWPATQTVTRGHSITYTVAVTAVNGFDQAVSLDVSGAPASADVAWATNPLTPTADTTLAITPSASGPTGTFTLIITGTSNPTHTTQVELVVVAEPTPPTPDFELDAWPATQTITRGHSITYTVAVTAVNGFDQAVTLDVSGAPTGAAVAWAANPLTPTADTTLAITPSASGPTGTFTLVITGTSNPTHTTQVELVVVDGSVPPVPDFALDVTPDSRSVEQGQTTSYDVSLTAIYGFADPVTLAVGGLPAGTALTWGENPLTPSAATVLTITTSDTSPVGDYTLVITATGGGIVHTDNVQLSITPPPIPNLIVQTIATDPEIPVVGQPCAVTLGIANVGTGHAPDDFLADWYTDLSAPPTPGATGDITWTQHGLGIGGVHTFNAVYTFTTAGEHVLYAQIDRTGVIAESDETDNVTGPLTVTVSSIPQPDLFITTMSINPVTPTLGRPTTLIMQIKNRGTLSTTGDVRVDGYVTTTVPNAGETGDVFTTTAPLDPGQSVEVQMVYTFTQAGAQTIYAQVDTLDGIAESIEDNNVRGPLTVTVRVPRPDLVIERIAFNPTVSLVGETVTATVRVRNQGDAGAPTFRTDWYLDPSAPPTTGQTGDGFWDVPGLSVGATTDLTMTHSFATTGTHWLYAQADTLEVITESIETNNVKGDSLSVADHTEDMCGTILTDTTWYAGTLYRVTCDVTVPENVTLTVEPGVAVRVGSSYGIAVNGTLAAVGTADAPVHFTADTDAPSAGYWDGIRFNPGSVNSMLEHTIVEYAGNTSTDYDGGLYLNSDGVMVSDGMVRFNRGYGVRVGIGVSPTVSATMFVGNTSYAGYVSYSSSAPGNPLFLNNIGSGNGKNGFRLSGSLGQDTELLVNPTLPWIINGGFAVNTGAMLTLPANTVMKFETTSSYLSVKGTLITQGTAEQPVHFTSFKDDSVGGDTNSDGNATIPVPGDWRYITITGDGVLNFEHAVLRYGGSDFYSGGYHYAGRSLQAYDNAHVTLTHVMVTDSEDYGIYLAANSLGEVTHLLIADSIIENCGRTGVYAGSDDGEYEIDVRNTSFDNNMHGIYISGDNTTSLEDNLFQDNQSDGINIAAIHSITLNGNTFTDNGRYAATLTFAGGTYTSTTSNTGSGNGKNGFRLSGSLGQDTELLVNPTLPWIINGGFAVNTGATLTLPANTVMKFETTSSYLSVKGTLITQGTAEQPVHFTSFKDDSVGGDTNSDGNATIPVPGDWRYITITGDGVLNFEHAVLRYGGSDFYSGGYHYAGRSLQAYDNAHVTLTHVMVTDSEDYGIYLAANSLGEVTHLLIADSIIENCGRTGVYAGSDDGEYEIDVRNTSFDNNMHGIYISGDNTTSLEDNLFQDNQSDGINIAAIHSITLNGNTFTDNGRYAATLTFAGGTYTSTTSNTGSGNGKNGFRLSGSLGQDTELLVNPTLPWIINGGFAVNTGATLTLPANTVMKFETTSSYLSVKGTLITQGTAEQPVHFTSFKDDSVGGDTNSDGNATIPVPGDWRYITITGDGVLNFEHAVLRYGGSDFYSGGYHYAGRSLQAYDNAHVTLTHVMVTDSEDYGIYLAANSLGEVTHLLIADSIIENCGRTGVYAGSDDGEYEIDVRNTSFDNNMHGIYISGDNTTSLEDNLFQDNQSDGINIAAIHSITLNGNTFTDNGRYAATLTFAGGTYTSTTSNTGSGNGKNGFRLSGSLGQDTELLVNPTLPWIINGGFAVNTGATLTLPANTVMKFETTSSYLSVKGTLITQGTAEQPVHFTSFKDDSVGGDTNSDGNATIPVPGDWRYITITGDGVLNFEHAVLRYGGSDFYSGGYHYAGRSLQAYDNAHVTLTHVMVTDSEDYGIYLAANSLGEVTHLLIADSIIENCGHTGVYAGSDDGEYEIDVRNTSFDNNMHGIYISGDNTTSLEDNLFQGNQFDGINIAAIHSITLNGNTFTDNGRYAATLTFAGGTYLSTANNTGSGNGRNGIVISGQLGQNTELPAYPMFPWIIKGTLTVDPGIYLFLPAGSIVKFDGTNSYLVVNGNLVAEGNMSERVYLTSIMDDSVGGDTNSDGTLTIPQKGDWGNISLGIQANLVFKHTVVRYGASDYGSSQYHVGYCDYHLNTTPGVIEAPYSNVNIIIHNSIIEYSQNAGIYVSGDSVLLEVKDSIIRYNGKPDGPSGWCGPNPDYEHQGIYYNSADGVVIIVSNQIMGNDRYGVYNGAISFPINARHNYWGDPSGPDPYGSGNGINYKTCPDGQGGTYICQYYVDADPWIGKQVQQSEDIIPDALPDDPARNTEPPEAGVPYIETVHSWYGNVFIGSCGGSDNEWQVYVDWNGAEPGDGTPGQVEFKMNGHREFVEGDADGAAFRYSIGDLRHGDNTLYIVAISADGQIYSRPSIVRPYRLTLPDWVKKLGVSEGDISLTYSPKYISLGFKAKYPVPAFEAKMNLPSNLPFIGGETGVRESQATLSLDLRTDGKGAVKLSGTTGFEVKDQEAGGTLWGKGVAGLTPGGIIALYEAGLGIELEGTLKHREPIVSVIPGLAAAAHTPIIGDILDTVYVEGKIEPSVNLETSFEAEDDGSALYWTGCEGDGELKLTLSLGAEICKDVEASVYGGGQGALQFQAPPNPSYLKKASGGFFVGAKLEALGLEASAEKTWEWSYEPQATRMMGGNTLTAPLPMLVARPVASSVTGWRVAQPDYGDAPYAQFVGNRPAVHASNAPMGILSLTETPLVTNLYRRANPALALQGSDAVLVWVHDDTDLPDSQSKEILSSWWNGLSWASPISVTDNTMSEFDPQMAFAGSDQAVAVWERINDPALPMTATFDFTITRKVELAYSAFDLNTHTWSTPALLTENEDLDHGAQLAAGQDGTVMVTWMRNDTGKLIGTSDAPDALHYAIWNGTDWSTAGVVTNSVTGALHTSLAYRDVNSATLVLSLDTDGFFTTTADIELFYTEWNGTSWSGLTQLTDNAVADGSPAVLYTSTGERQLVWLRDGQVHLLGDDWSATPTATQIESESAGLRDFSAALDDEDNLMLIWQGMSEAIADLYYALYDAGTATWNLESQLTNSDAMEKQISPAFDPNGQLMVAYALDHLTEVDKVISPTLTITEVTAYDHTDLYVLHYTPDTDLEVSDLSLPEYFENPWPGDTVNVYATVRNAGDWAVVSPTIAFYDGDPGAGGALITSTYIVSGPLAGGASEQVSIRWTVPVTPVQPHTLYTVLDPSGLITETDETNNVITLTTTLPDVAVSSVKTYYYDQHNVVPLAVVANNGPITATNILVEFREGTVTGTVAYSQTILELEPYGLVAITDTWDVSTWAEGEYTYYAVVDSGDTIFEVNEDDNWDYFPVKVLPDLVIYSGDVQANLNPATGGPVTVTVRNWGTADAADVKVTLYEGPVITTGATALYTWTVPSLAVDSDGDTTLNTTIDHRPNRLFAIADPGRVITEVEESNNVALLVQPISITFRYHDLESIIPSTATVTINGDWMTDAITLTGAADIYSITLNIANTPLNYRYAVDGDVYLINTYTRTVTPTVSTVYNDYRNVVADWAQLDGPATLSTTVGTPTTPITAQVYLEHITPLMGTTFAAEIGYGTSSTLTEWTWSSIAYVDDMGNNDRFVGVITPTISGVYSYTIRFDGNWGAGNPHAAWFYADLDGTTNGFDLGQVGVLTVP